MAERADRGFTLIELLITIALIAIVAGFVVPQFGAMIERNRVTSTTNSVVGLVTFARSEAIRRNSPVSVVTRNNSAWAIRGNSDTAFDPSSASDINNLLIRRIEEPDAATRVAAADGSNVAIGFRSNGMLDKNNTYAITVCSGDADGRQVEVTPGGRVDTSAFNGCP